MNANPPKLDQNRDGLSLSTKQTMSSHQAASANFPFVAWLRDVAPYIHSFREKTFVIAFAGELAQEIGLENLIEDIAMLHAMGMRIVLVHGIRPQIEEQLKLRKIKSKYGKTNMSAYHEINLSFNANN